MSTYRASEFRYCNILPSALIEHVIKDGKKFSGVIFREGFKSDPNWYNFERFVDIHFDAVPEDDQRERIGQTCGSCGMCCQNIPSHNIGIYMSPTETQLAIAGGHTPIFQGFLTSDGVEFNVMGVKDNGDCSMLGPQGCTLGDLKPLWCKIFHCRKFQGLEYEYAHLHTPVDEFLEEKKNG